MTQPCRKHQDSNGKRASEKGFTLVELLFVTMFISMLAASMGAVAYMSLWLFRTSGEYSEMTQGGMQSLRNVGRELNQTSNVVNPVRITMIAGAIPGNTTLRFQIPVDWDNDADAVCWDSNNDQICDAAGELSQTSIPIVEWGAYDRVGETANGRFNAWIEYSVVLNAATGQNQLIRRVVDGVAHADEETDAFVFGPV